MRKIILCLLSLVLLNVVVASARVRLPSFFADNMLLQQESKVNVWGEASPGERVTIKTSWDSKKYEVIPDTAGLWRSKISTPAAGGPFSIEISGKNKLVLKNILIGEVWLCSGQSNMDMPVKGYFNSPVLNSNELLAGSANSGIRMFHVAKKTASSPLTDAEGNWQEADVSSVKEFSAVGYQFAAFLNKYLNIPVGIIQVTWGGSPIESWMNTEALSDAAKQRPLVGGATTKAAHHVPSSLFNGMLSPLIGYNIAGVLWYQGEQNRYNYTDYRLLQPAMVNSWRKLWGAGNWPFLYVQIAPMHYPESQKHLLPYLREVQLKLLDEIPNSGMVVSIDAGEENNIHPANKEIIARRLAYLALAKSYKKAGLGSIAPQYKTISISKDTLMVHFSNAAMGITTFGKKLTQFELAGSDKVFYKATAEIKGSNVIVYSISVKAPAAVRYAFSDWAAGELYGTDGLPVSAFRSDDW